MYFAGEITCVKCGWTPSEERRKQYWPAFRDMMETRKMIEEMKETPQMCDILFMYR